MTDPNRPLPYADDVETIPVDEAEDTQQVIQALELILARSQAKSGQFRGDVHVKTHGYAQGELRVLPNLPDELAQGLFGHDGVYRQWLGSPTRPARPSLMPFRTGGEWRSRCWEWKETWCWPTNSEAGRRISS